MTNLSEADLVFSEQANHNFSRILGALKRSNLSIENRLRSIQQDADFVAAVRAAYRNRPLVANERCGSWYVPPSVKAASAYFKSTDGHQGQWKFSTRRLNLHLLPLIGENNGCIVVDSTRRGKRTPDALSKTIPIWCCVLNRALFPDLSPHHHDLYVPPYAVAEPERCQILARVPEYVAALRRLDLDLEPLRAQLPKPLRPVWVVQPETGAAEAALPSLDGDDDGDGAADIFQDFLPIICCTSSRRVVGTEMSESGYIQGAGDDTENWAHGLTPSVFWAHADRLLSTPEPDLPDLIKQLVSVDQESSKTESGPVRELNGVLSVAALPQVPAAEGDASGLITILLPPLVTKPVTWQRSSTCLEVGIGKGKLAGRNLRQALPTICSFVQQAVVRNGEGSPYKKSRVLVACETGKDISIGVALAIACRCLDDAGETIIPGDQVDRRGSLITKDSIRVKLGRIITAMPGANPSRATLQSVNSFLMDWSS